MRGLILALICVIVSSVGCISRIKVTEQDRHDVYSAVLNDLYRDDSRAGETLVVSKSILPGDHLWEVVGAKPDDLARLFPEASEDVLNNSLKRSEQTEIKPLFRINQNYILVDEMENYRDIEKMDADEFLKQYLKNKYRGLIRFSDIGFNANGDEAFLYIELSCAPLCSFGKRVLLKKASGKWQVIKSYEMWLN